jgi:hypothetical protein
LSSAPPARVAQCLHSVAPVTRLPSALRLAALGFVVVGLAGLSRVDARAGEPQASQTSPPASDPQSAQPQSASQTTTAGDPATQSAGSQQPDDDRLPSATEPDYRLVNLATTLRLPSHRMSFELTHRFDSNLMAGTFAQNASNLFGLDQGAAIGLEFRYAIARHIEAVIYRTNIEKTIQFSSKIDLLHEHAGTPLGVSAVISVEGTNNFHTNYQPGVSIVVSRAVATRLALYVEPTWVGRTGIEAGTNQSTSFVGLGARARVRRHLYLVAEISPRVNGYRPDKAEFGFGLEERVGGHVFQLDFSNTTSTTLAQVARGGFPNTLVLGFNLARKFF